MIEIVDSLSRLWGKCRIRSWRRAERGSLNRWEWSSRLRKRFLRGRRLESLTVLESFERWRLFGGRQGCRCPSKLTKEKSGWLTH